jgi:transcriptional regulator with XRE-family HTH domain
MAQLSTTFCRQLARARRDKGMTQSALAQAVGCKQSAISMLESGQPEKLSQETVVKIAKLLGVALDAPSSPLIPETRTLNPERAARGYCPNAACYSNVPFAVQGELLFWPRLQTLAAGGHCAFCGELLEPRCPHCGAAVAVDGACCPACGGARVTNTLNPDTDPDAWTAQRRREIAEWRTLLT